MSRRLSCLTVVVAAFAAAGCNGCQGQNNGLAGGVSVFPGNALVAVGAARAFHAVATDADGVPLSGVTPTWSISPASVASIDAEGVVHGVAPGAATVTATIGTSSSTAEVAVVAESGAGGTSTYDVINAAEASGELDPETALSYRVFATFADPRLPAQYQGEDEGMFEVETLSELNHRYESLSEATQATLGPFLMRPADVGSAWDTAVAARRGAGPATGALRRGTRTGTLDRPSCRGESDGWTAIEPTGIPVKVWYRFAEPLAQSQARTVTGLIENIWNELITAQGFPKPLDDTPQTGCHGKDAKLDVYLVALGGGLYGLTEPIGWDTHQAPVYMLLNKNLDENKLKASTTHEMMHAIQWAIRSQAKQASYGWMRDATANWAIDAVYPALNVEHEWADCYLSSTKLSIEDRRAGQCSRFSNVARDYGAYVFFQFVDHVVSRGAVKQAILNIGAHGTSGAAINAALPGGFLQQWREFAKRAWNLPPVDVNSFKAWDGLNDAPAVMNDNVEQVTLAGQLSREWPLDGELPKLSILYYGFHFPADEARSVTALKHMLAASFFPVSMQAFFKTQGSVATWEDWNSDGPTAGQLTRKFCRDKVADRLEDLAIVLSNGDHEGGLPTDATPPPKLGAKNIGCWKWVGQSAASWTTPMETYSLTALGLEFERDPAQATLEQYGPQIYFRLAGGTMAGEFTVQTPPCTAHAGFSGKNVLENGGSANGVISVHAFSVSGMEQLYFGSMEPGQYTANGGTTSTVTATVTCPDNTAPVSYPAGGPWLASTSQTATGPILKSVTTGGQMSGNSTSGNGTYTSTWTLTPVRE